MKIAITGKGGVGKTTLSAMLATTLSEQGRCVIALDADPDANLASALGVPPDSQPTPLSQMEEMIVERTGAADAAGGYFKLNPKVDDIPDRYAARIGEIRLLTLGGVTKGGGGCICPASALVKALLTHLVLGRDDAIVMDMEAGIEHLGRATAQSMDALIVVVDQGPWSRQTAGRIRELAADLGLTNVVAVANRVTDQSSADAIAKELGDVPLVGWIPYDKHLADGSAGLDGNGRPGPLEWMTDQAPTVRQIISTLQKML